MQQLSGLDQSFLSMETATTNAHVASLALYDPSTSSGDFNFDRLRELFAERIHLVAPFTRRLVEVPLSLDKPYWIEDPDFDIDYHVRHIAVPSPGGKAELEELAAQIMSRPLDRRRPLWESYVIDGVEGGLVGQLTKVHHSAIDGVSGAEILGALFDLTPEGREVEAPVEPIARERVPSQWEMLGRGAVGAFRIPAAGWKLARRATPVLPAIARNFVPGLRARHDPVLSRAPGAAPRTPFNHSVSGRLAWTHGSLPLDDVKAVKRYLDVTVNDVIMALCAGALRRWLVYHAALPDDPLMAMVPISVRTPEQSGTYGNRVSAMIVQIPTNLDDPVRRLQVTRDEMSIAKSEHAAIPAELLQDLTQFTPPAVLSMAARVAARARVAERVGFPFNVTISNVPGPQFPLYAGGARLVGLWPLSPIVDGVGLNMTLMSYNGSVDYGLLADADQIPDVERLGTFLADELATLRKAASE